MGQLNHGLTCTEETCREGVGCDKNTLKKLSPRSVRVMLRVELFNRPGVLKEDLKKEDRKWGPGSPLLEGSLKVCKGGGAGK